MLCMGMQTYQSYVLVSKLLQIQASSDSWYSATLELDKEHWRFHDAGQISCPFPSQLSRYLNSQSCSEKASLSRFLYLPRECTVLLLISLVRSMTIVRTRNPAAGSLVFAKQEAMDAEVLQQHHDWLCLLTVLYLKGTLSCRYLFFWQVCCS